VAGVGDPARTSPTSSDVRKLVDCVLSGRLRKDPEPLLYKATTRSCGPPKSS